jgi:hypothetical protein
MKSRDQVLHVLPVVMLVCNLLQGPAQAQFTQQGPKLVGTDTIGPFANQDGSVSLSGDRSAAIVGGSSNNNDVGFPVSFPRECCKYWAPGSPMPAPKRASARPWPPTVGGQVSLEIHLRATSSPLRSCNAGRFSVCRLTSGTRHLHRPRPQCPMDQSGDRASREDRKPRYEPNGNRGDRHSPSRQIVHGSMSPSY